MISRGTIEELGVLFELRRSFNLKLKSSFFVVVEFGGISKRALES